MAQMALEQERVAFATDMSVGEILRRTREHYGRSLADIEASLRIRAQQLEALENNDLDKLPGKVYAIGFVRAYSEYLGLDGDKMVHLFKVQASEQATPTELSFPAPASDMTAPSMGIVIGAVALIGLVTAVFATLHYNDRQSIEAIPPVPAVEKQVDITDKPVMGPALPTEEEIVLAEKPSKGIILNIIENSWVEIKDRQGNKLLSQVLNAGDQYFVPDRPDLLMSIGNAGGVNIEVDGQPLASLGAHGDVRRNIPLDAATLKQRFLEN